MSTESGTVDSSDRIETCQESESLNEELEKLLTEADIHQACSDGLWNLIIEFQDTFTLKGELLGNKKLVHHEIKVFSDSPVKQTVRCVPFPLKDQSDKEV